MPDLGTGNEEPHGAPINAPPPLHATTPPTHLLNPHTHPTRPPTKPPIRRKVPEPCPSQSHSLGAQVPGVRIFGPPPSVAPRSALAAFTVAGLHPSDLATFVDQDGIAIRAGHHCTQPLHAALGQSSGSVRAHPTRTRNRGSAAPPSHRLVHAECFSPTSSHRPLHTALCSPWRIPIGAPRRFTRCPDVFWTCLGRVLVRLPDTPLAGEPRAR